MSPNTITPVLKGKLVTQPNASDFRRPSLCVTLRVVVKACKAHVRSKHNTSKSFKTSKTLAGSNNAFIHKLKQQHADYVT